MPSIDKTSHRSRNYGERNQKIRALLIHSGEGTRQSDLNTLKGQSVSSGERVSAHYYVCRDGTIYQLVEEEFAAWHAGESHYARISDWNHASIGIETEHRSGQDWPEVQLASLTWLCQDVIQRHQIAPEHVAAHRWVALPYGRKRDPSDWTDVEFHRWVASLYTNPVDVWQAWGGSYPLPQEQRAFAIPQAWLNYRGELGEARSDEIYIDERTALRSFEKGLIMWEVHGGQISVIDRQGQAV